MLYNLVEYNVSEYISDEELDEFISNHLPKRTVCPSPENIKSYMYINMYGNCTGTKIVIILNYDVETQVYFNDAENDKEPLIEQIQTALLDFFGKCGWLEERIDEEPKENIIEKLESIEKKLDELEKKISNKKCTCNFSVGPYV